MDETPIHIVEFAPVKSLSMFIEKTLNILQIPFVYRTADLYATNVDDQTDIMNMSVYHDRQFDFFICSHVLEHVTDDRKALSELVRITKIGGSGILMVPIDLMADVIDEDTSVTDEAERVQRFGQNDHVRFYSKNGFVERVRDAGFEIAQYGAGHFGLERFVRSGITPQSVLYIVRRTH